MSRYLVVFAFAAISSTAALVGLNLVILAAATLCSYFAHDTDPKLEHLHRRTNQLNKAMRAIEAKYKKILTKQQQKLHRIQQRTQEIIYYYRKINQRVRPDHEKPKSFEQDHELGVEFEKDDESDVALDVECSEPLDDPRCTQDAFVRDLLGRMALLEGAP